MFIKSLLAKPRLSRQGYARDDGREPLAIVLNTSSPHMMQT